MAYKSSQGIVLLPRPLNLFARRLGPHLDSGGNTLRRRPSHVAHTPPCSSCTSSSCCCYRCCCCSSSSSCTGCVECLHSRHFRRQHTTTTNSYAVANCGTRAGSTVRVQHRPHCTSIRRAQDTCSLWDVVPPPRLVSILCAHALPIAIRDVGHLLLFSVGSAPSNCRLNHLPSHQAKADTNRALPAQHAPKPHQRMPSPPTTTSTAPPPPPQRQQ